MLAVTLPPELHGPWVMIMQPLDLHALPGLPAPGAACRPSRTQHRSTSTTAGPYARLMSQCQALHDTHSMAQQPPRTSPAACRSRSASAWRSHLASARLRRCASSCVSGAAAPGGDRSHASPSAGAAATRPAAGTRLCGAFSCAATLASPDRVHGAGTAADSSQRSADSDNRQASLANNALDLFLILCQRPVAVHGQRKHAW